MQQPAGAPRAAAGERGGELGQAGREQYRRVDDIRAGSPARTSRRPPPAVVAHVRPDHLILHVRSPPRTPSGIGVIPEPEDHATEQGGLRGIWLPPDFGGAFQNATGPAGFKVAFEAAAAVSSATCRRPAGCSRAAPSPARPGLTSRLVTSAPRARS